LESGYIRLAISDIERPGCTGSPDTSSSDGAVTPGPLVLAAADIGRRYEGHVMTTERKRRGQIFTPPAIAAFMAAQFRALPSTATILDPGAGVGILTAAVCDRVLVEGGRRRLHATLYEDHGAVIPFLTETMEMCRRLVTAHGHDFTYAIREADFILDNEDAVRPQRSLFGGTEDFRFDHVIMNPPYFKLNRDDPRVAVMEPVVHGQPNVYALFMAMGAALLDDGGQLVAITPRSYCSGPYFRRFRHWFFGRVQPRSIHVFGSRTEAFQEDDVLQENVILSCERTATIPRTVRVTRSEGRDIADCLDVTDLPYSEVVDNKNLQTVIRIPEHRTDAEIAAHVEHWPETFSRLGLSISTGPVVGFRARYALRDVTSSSQAVAPLLWLHNVRSFAVRWPVVARGKAQGIEVSERTANILVPAKNYVLIRRFSAKEERRRMTAGVLLASSVPHGRLGIENHLNYVYRKGGELAEDEAFGLTGLFNSALIDRYFRTISGNTQVNATEIRTMPLPPLDRIVAIGRSLRAEAVPKPAEVEKIVLDELGINGSLAESLLDACR
jgi:adenine-specific DNA-methyltransferase